jgi:hypothetical protein
MKKFEVRCVLVAVTENPCQLKPVDATPANRLTRQYFLSEPIYKALDSCTWTLS